MQTVAETSTTYKPLAFNATLDYRTHGVALRAADGRVFFQADSTGLWTQLFDQDVARLMLHGRTDLVRAAEIADGRLVVKASKTLQVA